MGLVQVGDYKYKAFISYSHTDRKWARWLHRRLETYPIPKNIIGNVTSAGPIPKRLKPIFRDREELSASNNLGEKIEAALASSQSLIIICSPAAAKSKWVNQEILTFKRNNRDAQLFSVIVEGEPYASGMPGREEEEECFPPALRYEVNQDGSLSDVPAEPLAADLRPHADGKRLGFLKLLSGMVGVGLDEVVQRDMKRSRKRMMAITSGSLATVLAMGTLTGFALDARQEAEQRRNDAEGLIEFMLGDLRDRLEPVGRLDVLDNVAKEVLDYYTSQENSAVDCKSARGKARAHYLEARISMDKREFDVADQQAKEALKTLLKFTPSCLSDPRFIINYTHAQQWAAEPGFERLRQEKLEKGSLTHNEQEAVWNDVLSKYQKSEDALDNLKKFEHWSHDYMLEKTDVDILFAKLFRLNDTYVKSKERLDSAERRLLRYFDGENPSALLLTLNLKNQNRVIDKYADLLTHISENASDTGNYELAFVTISKSQKLYEKLAKPDGVTISDWNAQFGVLGTKYSMARIQALKGKKSTSLDTLNSLGDEISTLISIDPSNIYWRQFKEKVLYSIENLTSE